MGASNVDMDTEAGWVKFTLSAPQQLDFARLADVMDSASYKLTGMAVECSGRVLSESGQSYFVVDQSSQRFAVDAASAGIPAGAVRMTVVEWATGSPKITVAAAQGS